MIVIVIIDILIILFLLYKIVHEVKNFKQLDEEEKDIYKFLLLIFIFPTTLWLLDYYNVFSLIFPKYSNISKDFDWLSFIATYSGTIISAVFLVIVTGKDRRANTDSIRESQRPYLDISYHKIKREFLNEEIEKHKNNVFNHGGSDELKSEYLVLCIKNNGESVAIIDTNKTEICLSYGKNKSEKFLLNFSINRLSLKSGETLYIKMCKKELYGITKLLKGSNITYSKVYYKDLFNRCYYDECAVINNKIEIIHDNELVNN